MKSLVRRHFIARHFIGRAFVHASCTLAANPRISLCDPCGVPELRPDIFVPLSHPHCPVTFVTPHRGVKPKYDTLPYKVRVLCTWVSKSDLSSYACRIRRSLYGRAEVRIVYLRSNGSIAYLSNAWTLIGTITLYSETYANTTWTVFLFFSELISF